MNAARTSNTRGAAYRIGHGMKRLYSKFNALEMNVARRVQSAVPAMGFALTRIVFLAIKLALVAGVFLFSVYLMVLAIAVVVVWALRGSGSQQFEEDTVSYSDINHPRHSVCYPEQYNELGDYKG